MAEPGAPWQATDVVMPGPSFPIRRLFWAVVNGDYYVVEYEHGGIAHSFETIVSELPKGAKSPRVVWVTSGLPLKDYAAFLAAMKKDLQRR